MDPLHQSESLEELLEPSEKRDIQTPLTPEERKEIDKEMEEETPHTGDNAVDSYFEYTP